MSNEKAVQELLAQAEVLWIKREVLDLAETLMKKNPEMTQEDAIKQALNHLKLFV